MRIRTLVENHANINRKDLGSEHGLSFLIENQGHFFMSDVGQSGKFADNAAKLGVDISNVEALAISHHHYDHGGGMGRFFEENESARVYLRAAPDVDFVATDNTDTVRYIGLDKGLLSDHAKRIVSITENRVIQPGLHLLVDIPDQYPKPGGDQRLKVRKGREMKPDPFEHELVTVVEGQAGLVLLTGCAHNGVLNMIAAVRNAIPEKPIMAVIGGFHLHHETPHRVHEIADSLLSMEIPAIYSGHCTGEEAMAILQEVLGHRFHMLYTGLEITF